MSTDYLSIFSSRLKASRKALHKSRKQIADLFGFDGVSTVSNWENEINYPEVGTLITLCEYLKVNPDWLLGFAESPIVQLDERAQSIIADCSRQLNMSEKEFVDRCVTRFGQTTFDIALQEKRKGDPPSKEDDEVKRRVKKDVAEVLQNLKHEKSLKGDKQ